MENDPLALFVLKQLITPIRAITYKIILYNVCNYTVHNYILYNVFNYTVHSYILYIIIILCNYNV